MREVRELMILARFSDKNFGQVRRDSGYLVIAMLLFDVYKFMSLRVHSWSWRMSN